MSDRKPAPSRADATSSTGRCGIGRSARFWSRLKGAVLAPTVLALLAGFAGCGGATTPCPTPTTELDSLRTAAEHLETQVDRETAEGRTLEARRDQASRRAASAQAALDSVAGARSR